MSDPERLLADLWAQDEPPERDHGFVLLAMERIERRRFWLSLLSLVPVTVLVCLVLWAMAPVLGAALGPCVWTGRRSDRWPRPA